MGASLVDPFADPYDLLTFLCNVVTGVGLDAISTGATVDVVLAPIHGTDTIVATPSASLIRTASEAQRVLAIPSVDAVGATVAVDCVAIGGAF